MTPNPLKLGPKKALLSWKKIQLKKCENCLH